jgi:hypothetical protein
MSIEIEGRKVFFIYPPSVLQEEAIYQILKNEYEIYTVNNHKAIGYILSKYPESIIFIDVDSNLKEDEWLTFVKEILDNPATKDTKIGILSLTGNKQLAEKYLMQIGVPCGFITMKIGVTESVNLILKVLEANEARGRRKFVRARCPDNNATFNVNYNGSLRQGHVIDLSAAGMACVFDRTTEIPVKQIFDDIQIQFKGTRVLTKGFVAGVRNENEENVYIIMFDPTMDARVCEKLRQIIHNCLQNIMDKELSAL